MHILLYLYPNALLKSYLHYREMIDFQNSLSLLFSFTLGEIKEFVDSFDSDTVSRILSYHLAVVFNSTKCIGFLMICRTASAVRNRETRMNPFFLYMLNLSNPILFLWSLRTALISILHNPELANVWRLYFSNDMKLEKHK